MVSLDALFAMWADGDAAKAARARTSGPRGWHVDDEGVTSLVLVDCVLVPVTGNRD